MNGPSEFHCIVRPRPPTLSDCCRRVFWWQDGVASPNEAGRQRAGTRCCRSWRSPLRTAAHEEPEQACARHGRLLSGRRGLFPSPASRDSPGESVH